jgi:hypothetical protein
VDAGYVPRLLALLDNKARVPVDTLRPMLASLLNMVIEDHGECRRNSELTIAPTLLTMSEMDHFAVMIDLATATLRRDEKSQESMSDLQAWAWTVVYTIVQHGES